MAFHPKLARNGNGGCSHVLVAQRKILVGVDGAVEGAAHELVSGAHHDTRGKPGDQRTPLSILDCHHFATEYIHSRVVPKAAEQRVVAYVCTLRVYPTSARLAKPSAILKV